MMKSNASQMGFSESELSKDIPPEAIVVVCALIEVIQGGARSVWAAQRQDGIHAGQWEFPGGKIEEGEFPQDALKREILEELHCRIDNVEPMGVYHYDYRPLGRKYVILHAFRCRLVAGEHPSACVHEALRLTSVADCALLPWVEADVAIAADWVRAQGVEWIVA